MPQEILREGNQTMSIQCTAFYVIRHQLTEEIGNKKQLPLILSAHDDVSKSKY